MKILYVHGFGSSFDPNNEKVKHLGSLGEVVGKTIDYTQSPDTIIQELQTFIVNEKIDLIVGTSLGGYYAAKLGTITGLLFVALNPSITPKETLQRYIGEGQDYTGKTYHLLAETVAKYSDFPIQGNGLILLDRNDTVIDPINTFEQLNNNYNVKLYNGGSHRFEHMEEALPDIIKFYEMSQFNYQI